MQQVQTQEEVPFSFEELFFSRTDNRGIILSGNTVFQRISQYSWNELYKRPHNIIRHHDMPKGVFYLLWNFLKQGKPIGAYVKNRAKDGRYYWVFAIATPIEGGYLSVRLKPSSDFFEIIKKAYPSIFAHEQQNGITPEASMKHILSVLETLGFTSYESFMAVAIRNEMEARNARMARKAEEFLNRYGDLTQRATMLIEQTSAIFSSYEANQYVPLNLQIQSAQLGDKGKTIAVISSNFSTVSAEIRKEIGTFNESAEGVFEKIYEGQFLLCTASIQREVLELFRRESAKAANQSNATEVRLLEMQLKEYQQKALVGLHSIIHNIRRLQEDCKRMHKCAASLEVIRVMGKVDAALLGTEHGALNELIDELRTFHQAVSKSLTMIEKYSSSMHHDTMHVLSSFELSA